MSDIEGLPPEVANELKATLPNKRLNMQKKIIGVIKDNGNTANLDDIIIGLYRKHGMIVKRRHATWMVSRMKNAGKLFSIKSGVYSLNPFKWKDGILIRER